MKNAEKMPAAVAKSKLDQHMKGLGKKFQAILREPELFLCAQPEKFKELRQLLQQVYDVSIKSDESNAGSAEILSELVVEDMDEEQIWQQLELRNNFLITQLVEKTAKMVSLNKDKLEIRLKEQGSEGEEPSQSDVEMMSAEDGGEGESDGEECKSDDEEDMSGEDENENNELKMTRLPKKKLRSSIVDDKFFKLGEMEAFLDAEDAKEMRKQSGKVAFGDDDGINYFGDNLGEDEDENPEYKDFFDVDENDEIDGKEKMDKNNRKQKKHFAEKTLGKENTEDDSEEDENNEDGEENDNELEQEQSEADKQANGQRGKQNEMSEMQPVTESDSDNDANDDEKPKSSFEMRQERLQQRIKDYEDEVLGEKPWQLKGEIQATSRPQNSLLEEVLEFESTTRPAPVITEDTTRRLEDIIRQRIKDQAWDDVELKIKPVHTPQEYRKQLVLDQEKSKHSLAQIYEKEYQKELEKLDPNHGDAAEVEPKEHKEIRGLMRSLFIKLDALSNFHFSPKPVAPEPKIITNTPAVNMEEVAPVAVSNAKLLAPEEVKKRSKYADIGKTERTKTDKNRERRQKKNKQKAIHKALEAKEAQKQKMGIAPSKKEENVKLLKKITKHRNVDKITASSDQGSLKSSKAFFSKLQDTAISKTTTKGSKKKTDAQSISAKKLKL